MLFMNDHEIDIAQQRRGAHTGHPNYGKAADTLAALRDWTDANSDGWAYWPKPCRAAKRLQQALLDANKEERDYRRREALPDLTDAELRALLAPVKAFLTRQGVDHSEVIL